jgi:transposase
MLIIPSGVKIHLALGRTDMRKGFDSLAVLVQEVLKKDPFSGHLFAFRGKKADTMKVMFWDGNGLCLFTKRQQLQIASFFFPRTIVEVVIRRASQKARRLLPCGDPAVQSVIFPLAGKTTDHDCKGCLVSGVFPL